MAVILFVHPPARRQHESAESIERQMHGLGNSLGLAESDETMPHAGPRIWLRWQTEAAVATEAAVTLDDTHLAAKLPPVPPTWSQFVADGGPVCIIVSLAPLPYGASRAVIDWRLADALILGRFMIGMATVNPECTS
ncbi:hypothetical protein AB0I84_38505 [Streptomyces spectabilis]|uniref:hypothetical protein n=1 Tax=Streptomyces spectabilis TaxID=68270 RepID=UPI0033D02F13